MTRRKDKAEREARRKLEVQLRAHARDAKTSLGRATRVREMLARRHAATSVKTNGTQGTRSTTVDGPTLTDMGRRSGRISVQGMSMPPRSPEEKLRAFATAYGAGPERVGMIVADSTLNDAEATAFRHAVGVHVVALVELLRRAG